jgi:hypothetical protein
MGMYVKLFSIWEKLQVGACVIIATVTPVAADELVIEELVSGQTITTSDSVANIEVRGQSFGPGACGVTFKSSGDQTSFLAPPLVWSPWTHLTSHIGSVTLIIEYDVVCDTGIKAQVKYYR